MTSGGDEKTALARARSLEKRGDAEAAAVEFMRAGQQAEAVRVLTAVHKFNEAARLILMAHRIDVASAGRLEDSALRKHALTAAILFGRGGETKRAVELFVALGERERAAELLRKAGDHDHAARLTAGPAAPAPKRGGSDLVSKLATPRPQSLQHQGPYEAALAFFKASQFNEGFDALAKASKDDPRYRDTCVKAIAVASRAGVLSFSLEHFLGPFVSSEPKSAAEAEAFYELASLYELKDLTENAAEAFRRLMLYDARFRDVKERMKRLGSATPIFSANVLGDALPELSTPGLKRPEAITEPARQELPSAPRAADPGVADRWTQVFAAGKVIAERYRLDNRLGSGGMAAVFKATDLELSIEVAVKAYFPVEGDDDALARFRRELRFARSVVHPNVVRVFDIGVFEKFRYLTMEMLEGQELRKLLARPMPVPQALDYLAQSCRGLQAAHDVGIVHRDIKPANLFVTTQGVVKVMDFGIARALGTPSDLTATGVVAGTPQFIAPEQIRDSSTVTPAADIYALGVVAYRMLAGVLPFSSSEVLPLLMAHLEKTPPPLREHNPFVDQKLEAVVLKCLAKSPADRYPSCAALAAELERLKGTP